MAEAVGFEPTEPLQARRISNPEHSTALPHFRSVSIAEYCPLQRRARQIVFDLLGATIRNRAQATLVMQAAATSIDPSQGAVRPTAKRVPEVLSQRRNGRS